MMTNNYRPTTTKVHIKVARKIGLDDIVISLSSRCDKGDERLEINRLFSEANEALTDYVNEIAPHQPANPQAVGRAGNKLVVAVTGFNVRVEKGMKIVKCLCTEYPEHGIIVYDEVLEQVGLTKSDIPVEGWKFKEPLRGEILFANDKPVKVIKLSGVVQL